MTCGGDLEGGRGQVLRAFEGGRCRVGDDHSGPRRERLRRWQRCRNRGDPAQELRHRRDAVVAVAGGGVADEAVDPWRQVRSLFADAGNIGVDVLVGHCPRRVTGVRWGAHEQLIQQHPGLVDVAALVALTQADLLGRQVRGRADQDPLGGGRRQFQRPGQAEVGHLDRTGIRHQDVLGLDVAVHESGFVGGGQGLQSLTEHEQCLLARHRTRLVQDVPHGPAGDVLHGQVDQSVGFALVVDAHHVGMGQPGGGSGLGAEA